MSQIHHVKAHEGEHYSLAGDVVTIKVSADNSANSMLVVDARVPAGGGPPAIHRNQASKVFYFLEGSFDIYSLDSNHKINIIRAEPGDIVSIPAMQWHNIKNIGSTTGRYLGIHSPPQMEPFIREVGQQIQEATNLPSISTATEQKQPLINLVNQYMEILPPEQFNQKEFQQGE
ncbi:cupin domain-containing protein [Dyadobacter fermentans]|uniref:cupin domain-containing protein n=1 Tax=Dyadobacter fermentans TaxID=94254 RepID=UPI001CC101C0|nr:cupin domain-containing protein [Dyadobacter fermentans]MBZ1362888.1 cupin domain-containing protein [Dyadobacter fermentans]